MRALCCSLSIIGWLLRLSCWENEMPYEPVSPDGEWKYVTFDRNCGATTRGNLQVTLLPTAARLPNEAGNTFIADDNHGAAGSIAQFEWLSPHPPQITYSSKPPLFNKESPTSTLHIT